jgi:hypothetical protein
MASDFSFAQPERRNFTVPILVALAILAIAAGLVYHFMGHGIAEVTVTHVAVLPNHTVFKSRSIVVGQDETQEDFYVLATVRVQDEMKIPIFIKDLTGTLETADGVQTSSAVEKNDFASLYTTFPALKPLAGPPLLREIAIQPGASAEGMVLLHFPITQAQWDSRTSATVTVDLYHQGPIAATIPKP